MKNLEDYRIKTDKLVKIGEENFLESFLSKPNGLQELFGLSDEVLNVYYNAALQMLEEKRWNDAADAFLFLSTLNPGVQSYWIGAGIAEQSQNNFGDALQYYVVAESIDPHDPVLHANAFQCNLALDDMETAKIFYFQALECCGEKEEHAAIKAKLEAYRLQLQT